MDRMHMRYRKPSEQIVRDLIFFNTGYVLPKEAVFGPVEVLEVDPELPYEIDTKVPVYIPKGVYSRTHGYRPISYRRLDLGMVTPQSNATITINKFPFSTYDVLTQINLMFNLALSQDDVQDTLYTDPTVPWLLIAKPGSLAWKNSRTLIIDCTALPELVTTVDIDGFDEVTVPVS